MASYQVLLLALLVYLVKSEYSYEPAWAFKCVPDMGCQRTSEPVDHALAEGSELFSSLSVCRTVCGRFGGLWPRPAVAALSMQTVRFHPKHLRYDMVDVPAEVRPLLVQMTQVTSQNLLAECLHNVTELVDTPVTVYLNVKSPNADLTWDTDEAYILDVQTKEGHVVVHISAETVYGARHGLESFSQLIAADIPDNAEVHKCSLRVVSGAKIKDRPAFKHRGLLLDTSRNFFPLEDIMRTINGMAAAKMNVFHWHVTDSHSFPLESPRVPQLTRYGAYSAYEIYTTDEVQELIKFAQVRGVRVLIEIDSPGHAGNGWQWGKDYGYGDLAVCLNAKQWRNFCYQPPCGQLNPANPKMYEVLRSLYRDIAIMLPKPALFHMGGDELFFTCWNSSQEIVDYMKNKGFNPNTVDGFFELWSEFHEKALKIWDEELAAEGGKPQRVILWSSELTKPNRIQKYLSSDRYVIEVWEPVNSEMLPKLLGLGYSAISVPKDIWYLDHGFWGTTTYSNWRRMYSHMLPVHSNLLGGEVAMWSEYIDGMGVDARIWPRTAAVAERLWSNPMTGANVAESRLQRLRERLTNRGLRPDVMSPGWCAQNDMKYFKPRSAAVAERLWSNPITGVNVAESRLQRLRERLMNRGLRPDVMSPGWCAQNDMKCL